MKFITLMYNFLSSSEEGSSSFHDYTDSFTGMESYWDPEA